jgi:hypothetical protein
MLLSIRVRRRMPALTGSILPEKAPKVEIKMK